MPVTVRRSGTALGFGIALLCVGTVVAATTAPFLHAGTQTCNFNGSGYACSGPGIDEGLIALTAVSLAGALAGIPLIVYGAGRVPIGPSNEAGAAAPLPRWAGAPGARGWGWSF